MAAFRSQQNTQNARNSNAGSQRELPCVLFVNEHDVGFDIRRQHDGLGLSLVELQ
jgi:hypothetical protein